MIRLVHTGAAAALGAAAASWALAAVAAGADAESEPIHVVVRAPDSCADSDAFLEAVTRRTSHARAARADEAARTFRVAIEKHARAVTGQLIVVDVDGKTSPARTVRGATCEEVATALELVTALAIDPDAQMDADPPSDASAPDAASLDTGATGDAALAASADATEPTDSPLPTDDAGLITLPEPAPFEPSTPPVALAVGAGADLIGTGDHPVSPAALAFAELQRPAAPGSGSIVAPSLRLSLSYFASRSPEVESASALFKWYVAGVDACPLRVPLAANVTLIPCATVEAGEIHAASSGTKTFQAESLVWLTAGAAARVEWTVADPFFLELGVALRVPLSRKEFVFQPDLSVYRVPLLLASGGIDLGVRFR